MGISCYKCGRDRGFEFVSIQLGSPASGDGKGRADDVLLTPEVSIQLGSPASGDTGIASWLLPLVRSVSIQLGSPASGDNQFP